MKTQATLIHKERMELSENSFVDWIVWKVSQPVPGSAHGFKYRLAFVVDEVCVLRYDNEAGKGDHKHIGERQVPYAFATFDRLVNDFWADVARLGGQDE